jgi:hypothetical protein
MGSGCRIWNHFGGEWSANPIQQWKELPLPADHLQPFSCQWELPCNLSLSVFTDTYLRGRDYSSELYRTTAPFSRTTNRERAAESSGMAVGVWQDGTYGMQYWLRSGVDREEIQLGINTKWNQTVIEYLDGKYYLYLNGNLIYTSRMIPYRPIHIWIGHPAELSGDCLWSSLEIDYIAVESLP